MASAVSLMGGFPNLSYLLRRAVAPSKDLGFHREKSGIQLEPLAQDGTFGSFEASGFVTTGNNLARRKLLLQSTAGFVTAVIPHYLQKEVAIASEFADMPALRGKDYGKTKMRFPDYTETASGLQFKDLRIGDGPTPKMGEIVVILNY
uniref:Peptidyl-prolyl cis-trans isomerase FKBP19, chloroplastic n=1 Tax=Anthurium amnicola TaxID=1678845 RepID=A0A1D1YSX3_9ARAE